LPQGGAIIRQQSSLVLAGWILVYFATIWLAVWGQVLAHFLFAQSLNKSCDQQKFPEVNKIENKK
jgi:hypothetical protein